MNKLRQYTPDEFLVRIKKVINNIDCPGIYFLFNKNHKLVYIGKSSNLAGRIYASVRKRNAFYVSFAITETVADAALYEIWYINKYNPPLNKQHTGYGKSSLELEDLDFSRKFLVEKTKRVKTIPSDVKNTLWQSIGFQIKQKRTDQHLTQEQLGAKVDANRSYIARLEGGKRPCSLNKLGEIADALNCELNIELS